MNVALTEQDIIALQQSTEIEKTITHSNKCKPDGQMKDTTDEQQRIVFPAFDLSTKKMDMETDPTELPSSPMKSSAIPPTPPYKNLY